MVGRPGRRTLAMSRWVKQSEAALYPVGLDRFVGRHLVHFRFDHIWKQLARQNARNFHPQATSYVPKRRLPI